MNKKNTIDFLKSVYALRLFLLILILYSINEGYKSIPKGYEIPYIYTSGVLSIALAITYVNNKE